MAGRAKENLPGGSLKYLCVYLKVRIFKCSYRKSGFIPIWVLRWVSILRWVSSGFASILKWVLIRVHTGHILISVHIRFGCIIWVWWNYHLSKNTSGWWFGTFFIFPFSEGLKPPTSPLFTIDSSYLPWRNFEFRQVDLGEPPVSDPKRLRLTSVRPQFPRPHIPSNKYRVIQDTRGSGGGNPGILLW